MDYLPYHSNYHSCTNIIITAMLKRLGVNTELIWSQAGMVYWPEKDGLSIMEPYYLPIADQLRLYHGVQWVESTAESGEILCEQVDEILRTGVTVGVIADVYELSYLPVLKGQIHDMHMLEVIRDAGEHYEICDHYYRYVGRIAKKDLIRATNSYRTLYQNYQELFCFYITRGEKVEQAEQDFNYYTPILMNAMVMNGDTSAIPVKERASYGLDTFLVFRGELEQHAELVSKDWLNLMYKMIREMSYSRYHYHVFLNLCGLREVAETVLESSQQWMVLGNLVARGLLREEMRPLVPRMNIRLERIAGHEEQSLGMMNDWIVRHPDRVLKLA